MTLALIIIAILLLGATLCSLVIEEMEAATVWFILTIIDILIIGFLNL